MLHALDLLITTNNAVIDKNRVGVSAEKGEHILHLDMAAEAYHLVTDGMLESEHNADGDNHHSQTDSDANSSDADGRTAHFTFVALIAINAFGYKKRKIQEL